MAAASSTGPAGETSPRSDRAWFAGLAMHALMSKEGRLDESDFDRLARDAWNMADKMVAQQRQRGE